MSLDLNPNPKGTEKTIASEAKKQLDFTKNFEGDTIYGQKKLLAFKMRMDMSTGCAECQPAGTKGDLLQRFIVHAQQSQVTALMGIRRGLNETMTGDRLDKSRTTFIEAYGTVKNFTEGTVKPIADFLQNSAKVIETAEYSRFIVFNCITWSSLVFAVLAMIGFIAKAILACNKKAAPSAIFAVSFCFAIFYAVVVMICGGLIFAVTVMTSDLCQFTGNDLLTNSGWKLVFSGGQSLQMAQTCMTQNGTGDLYGVLNLSRTDEISQRINTTLDDNRNRANTPLDLTDLTDLLRVAPACDPNVGVCQCAGGTPCGVGNTWADAWTASGND
eukprot:Filipodium_phascolosomae@DN2738_c0_g2_i4.p1